MALKIGKKAPDFTLPSTSGKNFSLSKDCKGKACIIYFYPKDFTKVCTAEACDFRDQFAAFRDLDIPVLRISRDDMPTHLRFKKEYKLPFELFSDEKGNVCNAYDANPTSMEVAIKTFGEMTGKKHKMIILGDMYELRDSTESEHEKLGEWVSQYNFDKICFVGKHTQAALAKAPMKALYFPDPFSFRNWLQDSKLEDHLILIKGSRGMKLEGLVDFI